MKNIIKRSNINENENWIINVKVYILSKKENLPTIIITVTRFPFRYKYK
jgi:hypothetical protein